MKKEVKASPKPGVLQTTFVFVVCTCLLIAAAYVGIMLLTGQQIGSSFSDLELWLRSLLIKPSN